MSGSPVHVHLMGHGFDVLWVRASASPTEVVEFQPIRDRADEPFVTPPVGEHHVPCPVDARPDAEQPVAVVGARPEPNPASVRLDTRERAEADFRIKSRLQRSFDGLTAKLTAVVRLAESLSVSAALAAIDRAVANGRWHRLRPVEHCANGSRLRSPLSVGTTRVVRVLLRLTNPLVLLTHVRPKVSNRARYADVRLSSPVVRSRLVAQDGRVSDGPVLRTCCKEPRPGFRATASQSPDLRDDVVSERMRRTRWRWPSLVGSAPAHALDPLHAPECVTPLHVSRSHPVLQTGSPGHTLQVQPGHEKAVLQPPSEPLYSPLSGTWVPGREYRVTVPLKRVLA